MTNLILLSLERYFENKGHTLNKVGIEILAINKFLTRLTHYLDTGEPFPLTKDFIETVEKDVRSKFEGYVHTRSRVYPATTTDPMTPEEIKKIVEDIGVGTVASFTAKKEYEIKYLIEMARSCFMYAGISFFISDALAIPRIPSVTTPESNGSKSILSPITNGWSNVCDAADDCLRRARREIDRSTLYIKKLIKKKNRARVSNKKKAKKFSEKRQRVLEISYTFNNREKEMGQSYAFAKKIAEKWLSKGYTDKPPCQNTIIKYLKEEKNKK